MLPFVDRSLIALFSGVILSYLEASGVASPQDHNANVQNLQTVVGGIVGAITIISFFLHSASINKNSTAAPANTNTLSSLFSKLTTFIFKSNAGTQTVTQVTTEAEVQPAA